MKIKIYTDGACSGNTGKGGWAAIILDSNANQSNISGNEKNKTKVEVSTFAGVQRMNNSALKASIKKGPTSVGIEADSSVFQHYTSGILSSDECGPYLNHGVLAVGYGSEGSRHD